jgi:hypothetical protein
MTRKNREAPPIIEASKGSNRPIVKQRKHATPTSSSWLNMVERWFRELTEKQIRGGSFHNVPALISVIEQYIETHNQKPQLFVWSAPVGRILAQIAKCKEALDALH